MRNKRSFGQVLHDLRIERNLTQRELAEFVAARLKEDDRRGFTFTYLSKIENDRLPPPSIAAILELAAVLETDKDDFLALAGKTAPDIGQAFKESAGARAFFRSARSLNLNEEDWKKLLENLQKGKGDK